MNENFEKKKYISASHNIPDNIKDFMNLPIRLGRGDSMRIESSNLAERIMEMDLERKDLDNKRFRDESGLKKKVLSFLMWLFVGETAAIFAISFIEVFTRFDLDPWNFRILVGATITQVYLMLRIAVEHLFPKNSH